jgi:hypothetical protein
MLGIFHDRRTALVVAHPGHELRVYHWLNLARPRVFILTDGSGHSGASRLHRTTSILDSLSAPPGSIYGRFTDAQFYSAILKGDQDLFAGLASELARGLIEDRIEYVVGDAIEGYNPTHDVCRLLLNTAVKMACQVGNCVDNFEIHLADGFSEDSSDTRLEPITIVGDDPMQSRKLRAARDYSELADDVGRIVETEGAESLRTEYFHPVRVNRYEALFKKPPYYEIHGERQVAAGLYKHPIRYRDHLLPIAEGLRRFAEGEGLALLANSDY